MNTNEINYILFNNRSARRIYLGAFPCDKLPRILDRKCAIIINTDPHDKPGQHWTALFYNPRERLEYFDSYGQPPTSTIKYFLRKIKLPIYYNRTQIQKDLSTVCAQYCIFFVMMKAEGKQFEDIIAKFDRIADDDKYIVKWLRKRFGIVSREVDKKYLNSRILRLLDHL